ncbi:LOW QUALITY PROTEIN: hypothetical protein CVT26_005300 [Gymnopilus dilepis]|uniref:Uncharacterized protein n=1 Tax=Gymnopilus dilepis TaxID=231916 RepID=A0A409YSW1_9AGAR|nr:LOW QUALITY PROTEIN: hypothetical protein CVT26_005300 [Gymnopilus dilepis]
MAAADTLSLVEPKPHNPIPSHPSLGRSRVTRAGETLERDVFNASNTPLSSSWTVSAGRMGIEGTRGGAAQASSWDESRILEFGVANGPEIGMTVDEDSLPSTLEGIDEWETR